MRVLQEVAKYEKNGESLLKLAVAGPNINKTLRVRLVRHGFPFAFY
jgi:hypothetical protein